MFTVSITKKTIEERPAGKDWELTGLDDPKYAYTPEIVKKKEVEEKIYEQTVDAIDIVRVISAVNGGLYKVQPTIEELTKLHNGN